MKAVMISIQPKWVEKICSGEKTIEVRKTAPKIKTPFKCYIYMTQGKLKELGDYSQWIYENRMKVIGEFICEHLQNNFKYLVTPKGLECAFLTEKELDEYLGYNGGYGWHISDLKIYDKPKEISEFRKLSCVYGEGNEQCTLCDKSGYNDEMRLTCYNTLTRPPQSWQFVEEL